MRKINCALLDARFDAGLTIKRASSLLGEQAGEAAGRYERGRRVPTLEKALLLEIIYHRPVAFLFPELYEELKRKVRTRRGVLSGVCQRAKGGVS